MIWIAVAIGGALGAAARHGVNELVQRRAVTVAFPYATFIVNVSGCLAIGLFAGALAGGRIHASPVVRAFVVTGILGGFTTFSAFSLDTLVLAQSGRVGSAAFNVAGQVVLGMLAIWAGFAIASGR